MAVVGVVLAEMNGGEKVILAPAGTEGGVIVAKNGKMGAINSDGKKVIPVIYKTLEFDIETGIFTATNDKYHYIIDYEGKIIRRAKIESEVANATKEEYHIVNF